MIPKSEYHVSKYRRTKYRRQNIAGHITSVKIPVVTIPYWLKYRSFNGSTTGMSILPLSNSRWMLRVNQPILSWGVVEWFACHLISPISTRIWVVNSCPRVLSWLICESWISKPICWQMIGEILTKLLLPKRKFCQELVSSHGKAVLHSYLEIFSQLYRKVIVFQHDATQNSNDTMAFQC